MAGNKNLGAAKAAKNDEFYTQWRDIENEILAYLDYDPNVFRDKVVLLPCDDPATSNFTKYFALNFESLGIKKLVSTSYAPASNPAIDKNGQYFLFDIEETAAANYNEDKHWNKGRVYVLERGADFNGDGKINKDDLKWDYLDGDGDFRSDEVTKLRDEADIVVTNPPFSLFSEFMAWLVEGNLQFSIIGNPNAITYNDIFPLIQENKLWLGTPVPRGSLWYAFPESEVEEISRRDPTCFRYEQGKPQARRASCWFTNIQHGRRYEPMVLMSMEDNLLYGSKKIKEFGYLEYENFEAIDIPEVKSIPSDYDGIMGVPISFLHKYNPEQFEIIANGDSSEDSKRVGVRPLGREFIDEYRAQGGTGHISPAMVSLGLTTPKHRTAFKRIFIRHRHPEIKD